MELGPPISYMALEKGTAVLSSDGEQVGRVVHVLADEGEDVFEGIVIEERGAHGGHRFADAEAIAEIHTGGVVLKLDRAQALQLPKPSANPAVLHGDSGAPGEGTLARKLRRAWDYLSGNY